MFDFLFGWRKASKCKKLIKRVQCRLKLLKTKRYSIVRQIREDVAQLIKIGYEDIAFNRAEHLFIDETIMDIYELLDNFCDFILVHISYIRKHKDCPNDINEAVSSLIFASARCGDLPELRSIRKLFGERYGQRFEMTALELLPGNLVNLQVKEKLSIKSVPDDVKQKLVAQISRDYSLKPEIFALAYTSELQQQVLDIDFQTYDKEGKAKYADAASTVMSTIPFGAHQEDKMSTSITSSIVERSPPDIMKSPMNGKAGLESPHKFEAVAFGSDESQKTCRAYIPNSDHKQERKMTASSSESLPQLPEEMITYLDDVEEVQQSIKNEGSCQDQRIFKFKSSVLPTDGKAEDCYSDSSSSCSTRKREKAVRKRTRRRSFSRGNSSVKDIECLIYYDEPYTRSPNPRSHLHSKHLRKNVVQNSEQAFHEEKRQKHPHSCCCFNLEAECCCHPYYFYIGDGRDDQKSPRPKQNDTISHGLEQKHVHKCCRIGKPDTEMEWYTFPDQRPRRRSCEFGGSAFSSLTNSDCQPDKRSKVAKGKVNEFDPLGSHFASNNSSPKATSPLTRKAPKPPYLRAMTMPQERSKGDQTENAFRSSSFAIQSPNHVHPKLPNYEELAAKFLALKKEHLRNRHQ
ncbi:hypothetical protein P3X46_019036 [Hevea brasiliensis]|uniref:IST1-like protein n=1 Tax=Hevea brasiliensis TaxID=3981 RepID=A0ABQ9LVT3_HEVBR|nr:uncharacterized protein LOC110668242 [Hevea brasiliensis]KAJ9170980.1 hypothetical protein P3X46_019036 [Hevea brasiliensis]